jgi:hypothetical protein
MQRQEQRDWNNFYIKGQVFIEQNWREIEAELISLATLQRHEDKLWQLDSQLKITFVPEKNLAWET